MNEPKQHDGPPPFPPAGPAWTAEHHSPAPETAPAATAPAATPAAPDAPAVAAAAAEHPLRDEVYDALRTVYDPEIPVNILDLGLVYDVSFEASNFVRIRMTLTSPSCPEAEAIPPEVEQKVAAVPGVGGVSVDIVWEPPWNPDMMSEEAKLELNMF